MATDRQYFKEFLKGLFGSHQDASDPNGEIDKVNQIILNVHLDDEDTAGTAVEEFVVFYVPTGFKYKVVSVDLSPTNAVTANDTNFASVFLQKRTDGGSATTIATETTETSGSGGSGNITAFDQVSVPLTASATELAAGTALTAKVTKTAAGAAIAGANGGPALMTVVLEAI